VGGLTPVIVDMVGDAWLGINQTLIKVTPPET